MKFFEKVCSFYVWDVYIFARATDERRSEQKPWIPLKGKGIGKFRKNLIYYIF